MHIVCSENCEEAEQAVKDILKMYLNMTDYNGFGHSTTVSLRFDPVKFVDAKSDELGFYVDMDLLRTGSAIAFISFLFDTWLEGGQTVATKSQLQALRDGKLSAFPDIEAVANEAIERSDMEMDNSWFDDVLQPIYRKYVLAYFRRLSECDRSSEQSLRRH